MKISNVQTSPNEEEKQQHLHSKDGPKPRPSYSVTSNGIRKGEAVPKSYGTSWSMDDPRRNATHVADGARSQSSSYEDSYGGGIRSRKTHHCIRSTLERRAGLRWSQTASDGRLSEASAERKLHNYGRGPLNGNFGAYRGRPLGPLPFSNEDAYGASDGRLSEASAERKLRNCGRGPLNWDFGADRARPLPFSNEDAYGGGSRLRIGGKEQVLSSGNRGNGAPVKLPLPPTGVKSKQKPTHLVDLSVKLAQKEASIPQFGGWNSDPSEAENYTIAFSAVKVERKTSLSDKVPPTAHQQPRNKSQQQQVKLAVPSNGMKPEQKSTHRVSRSVKVTEKNKGCFCWF